MSKLLRTAPFTSIFVASELFLLTAPITFDVPVLAGLLRLFIIPAYALITIAVWLTPWNNHWQLVLTVLAVVGLIDWVLRRSDNWRPGG